MKNAIKLLGIIALAAVIGFVLASCDNVEETVNKVLGSVRYLTADALGNVYELVISQPAGKYVGQQNDNYRLGIWKDGVESETSTGTVSSSTPITGGQKYGLKKGDATAFTVSVSDTWITDITGTIPLDGDTTQEAPTSVVARGTLANAEDVVYSDDFGSDNAEAKAITDFGYGQGEGGAIVHVVDVFPGTSIKVNGGKVSVTLGTVSDDKLETLAPSDIPTGVTVTPSTGVKFTRQDEPTCDEKGNYFFACVKTAQTGTNILLEYAVLIYTDTAFSMNGTGPEREAVAEGDVKWKITETWNNCSIKKGWNYYLTKEEIDTSTNTVKVTYSTPADSTKPPEGYKWTVISKEKASILSPYPHN